MEAYKLTPDAQLDLLNINRFTIREWGKAQAKNYISGLKSTIKTLSETPTLGKHPANMEEDISCFPYKSHVIYYVLNNKYLVVFAVLHGSMSPNRHLITRQKDVK